MTARSPEVITMLLSGQTVDKVAEACGVARSTVYRWLETPELRDELGIAKRAVVDQVANKIASEAAEMADILAEIARNGNDERARVAAGKIFLDFASRYRSDLVMESRIAALEKIIEQQGAEEPE
ncbi:MAG: helix-turn-helix domain-containing protein [Candidatus Eremiobacteraeota bacterium]|nr:helix-turn-helix domain-containing protein [Candidatus Eremiobacteraeota bacterium]MCW5869255.1 helix-turn-helix domain-containing protein [Candidatus Eremiobacteraeota bacterium]